MTRFIPTFFVVVATFVFANAQLGFAQIQILDGDGKQVAPNAIPAEKVDAPENELVPDGPVLQPGPQIFGGNGSSIIIRQSFSSVDENGDLKTKTSGKAIVIGPDGKQQEFDLDEGDMQLNPAPMQGEVPGSSAKQQAKSFSIGVECEPIHPAVASQLNLETGLMVAQVPPGTPAATAGIQQHDVLLFADDKQLANKVDLARAVKAAGDVDANISLTLIRGGKEMSVVVKPEQRLAGRVNEMPQLNLPVLELNELFGEDALGKGMEARMRHQFEQMRERFRRMEMRLGNEME